MRQRRSVPLPGGGQILVDDEAVCWVGAEYTHRQVADPTCVGGRLCPFLDACIGDVLCEWDYYFIELHGYQDTPLWIHVSAPAPDSGQYIPHVMEWPCGTEGSLFSPSSESQKNHFTAQGVITNLAELLDTTRRPVGCGQFEDGPIQTLALSVDVDNKGYYFQFIPAPGWYGEKRLGVLIQHDPLEKLSRYRVTWYVLKIHRVNELPVFSHAGGEQPPDQHLGFASEANVAVDPELSVFDAETADAPDAESMLLVAESAEGPTGAKILATDPDLGAVEGSRIEFQGTQAEVNGVLASLRLVSPAGGFFSTRVEVSDNGVEGVSDPNACTGVFPGTEPPPAGVARIWIDVDVAPVALCKAPFTVPTTELCRATLSPAQVDGGSTGKDLDRELSPSGPLAVGEHVVTLTVTDSDGLTDSCETTVTVADSTGPVVSLSATPRPAKKGATSLLITATGTIVDDCALDAATITVTDSEGPNVVTDAPLTVAPDGSFSFTFSVPATRDKKRSHVYKVVVTATDASGNVTTETAAIPVT